MLENFRKNRTQRRLDKLMTLMASDITYNEYLNVRDQLLNEVN